MKKPLALIILTVLLILPTYGGPINGKTLSAIGKVGSGATAWVVALFATAGGVVALDSYLASGEAAYALRLDLNGDASSIYWADIFSKPDIFPIIQIEGVGSFIIPEVVRDYSGSSVIWTFKRDQIPRGREVNLLILDDDSLSDNIWSHILSTRWNARVGSDVTLYKAMSVSISGSGTIQLTDGSIAIDGPDQLCHYRLKVPYLYFGGSWSSEGTFTDANGQDVGNLRFSQVINK